MTDSLPLPMEMRKPEPVVQRVPVVVLEPAVPQMSPPLVQPVVPVMAEGVAANDGLRDRR